MENSAFQIAGWTNSFLLAICYFLCTDFFRCRNATMYAVKARHIVKTFKRNVYIIYLNKIFQNDWFTFFFKGQFFPSFNVHFFCKIIKWFNFSILGRLIHFPHSDKFQRWRGYWSYHIAFRSTWLKCDGILKTNMTFRLSRTLTASMGLYTGVYATGAAE